MRLSTGLAAATFVVAPAADAADGRESQEKSASIIHGADVATSEADDGTTVSLAPGLELAVALRAQSGSGCRWRLLQFDSSILQGLGEPDVQFEPKPDRNMVGFFVRETFRFRVKRAGETGVAFGYFRPWDRTPPEKQVRILVRTG
jgi:predicted secreted protein